MNVIYPILNKIGLYSDKKMQMKSIEDSLKEVNKTTARIEEAMKGCLLHLYNTTQQYLRSTNGKSRLVLEFDSFNEKLELRIPNNLCIRVTDRRKAESDILDCQHQQLENAEARYERAPNFLKDSLILSYSMFNQLSDKRHQLQMRKLECEIQKYLWDTGANYDKDCLQSKDGDCSGV